MVETSILISAAAGLGSFISPCILPILPAFLSYLSGLSINEIQKESTSINDDYNNRINSNKNNKIRNVNVQYENIGQRAATSTTTAVATNNYKEIHQTQYFPQYSIFCSWFFTYICSSRSNSKQRTSNCRNRFSTFAFICRRHSDNRIRCLSYFIYQIKRLKL